LAVSVTFKDFGQSRTTQTQTSETQTNGTLALYLIERDLGQAGYGLMNLQNCPYINYYYNTGFITSPFPNNLNALPGSGTIALTTLPVRIVDGDVGSDTLEVQFGRQRFSMVPINSRFIRQPVFRMEIFSWLTAIIFAH
jgi:hypothetical protein